MLLKKVKKIWTLGWQTYIHQVVLSKMIGDIYHWCDVGCHFNKNEFLIKDILNSFER